MVALEINEQLSKLTTVSSQLCEGVRAKLRILIRHTLQRYKYSPDKATTAIKLELELELLRVLSNHWNR